MVSDRAWSQAVLTAKSAASLQCFLLTKPRRKSICGARIHAFMEYAHEHSLTPSRWSKLRCTRAHTHKHAHERTRRTVLSPWLSRAICLSPPSPLTAAACPGQLRASQKSPSAIQQHINLLKSQPFQKGRRHSNLSAVVRGNIISLSQIHDSVTSALDDMKSEGGGEEASAFSFLLISFSFSPLISCLWVLSLKAILCLCPSFHICMNTVAFQSTQWVAPQPGLAQRSGWSGID